MRTMPVIAAMLLSALAMTLSLPAHAQTAPPDGTLEFAIVRGGDEVGFHRFAFRREGDRLMVDITVQAQVRVLGITVYRFTQRASETWRNGRLVAFDSTAHNDGTDVSLRIREGDGGLVAESGGRRVRHPADAILSDVWNPAQRERRSLIHALDGTATPSAVRDLGERTITVQGRPVAAHGWYIDAPPDYQRALWFDASGRLVHLEQRARDGSAVEYRLR